MYSTKSFAKMKKFEGDISKAPLGTVLCMHDGDDNGHVGIVVAEDRFVDFYKYNETCRMGKTSESLFKFAVYITGVEYVESLPPYVFTVSLNPDRMTHFVGDPVQKEDPLGVQRKRKRSYRITGIPFSQPCEKGILCF
jgi:hypothetical protein